MPTQTPKSQLRQRIQEYEVSRIKDERYRSLTRSHSVGTAKKQRSDINAAGQMTPFSSSIEGRLVPQSVIENNFINTSFLDPRHFT